MENPKRPHLYYTIHVSIFLFGIMLIAGLERAIGHVVNKYILEAVELFLILLLLYLLTSIFKEHKSEKSKYERYKNRIGEEERIESDRKSNIKAAENIKKYKIYLEEQRKNKKWWHIFE